MDKKQLRSVATRYFAPLMGLAFLAIAVVVVRHQLEDYRYQDILDSLHALSGGQLGLAVAWTALGYGAMTGYDTLGFFYVRQPLAYPKVALTTFISCAFSNTIGVSLLTGSAIRYRFYAGWHVPPMAIAQVIAFSNFSFWLGLLAVGGSGFLLSPFKIPLQLHLPFQSTSGLGIIFLAIVVAYLLCSLTMRGAISWRDHSLRLPRPAIALLQIVVSSLDWSLAAATLYCLLPMTAGFSYLAFLKIYLLAMAAGVLSNVPGGLGVFESVVILLLSTRISPAAVLASLLAYRAIYYFLPLILAIAFFGIHEIRQHCKVRQQ